MSVQIVIDSACDLPKATADNLGLHYLPMRTIFDDVEYLDGVTMKGEEFYERLIETDAACDPLLAASTAKSYIDQGLSVRVQRTDGAKLRAAKTIFLTGEEAQG